MKNRIVIISHFQRSLLACLMISFLLDMFYLLFLRCGENTQLPVENVKTLKTQQYIKFIPRLNYSINSQILQLYLNFIMVFTQVTRKINKIQPCKNNNITYREMYS